MQTASFDPETANETPAKQHETTPKAIASNGAIFLFPKNGIFLLSFSQR
jgi:hypothetical protein